MLAERNIPLLHNAIPKDRAVGESIDFLEHLFVSYPRHDFQVRFWDGTTWGGNKCRFTLVLKHPGALRRMFTSPSELTLGEAYIFDDFDIEGDIEASFDLGNFLLSQERAVTKRLYLAISLGRLPTIGRPRAVPRPLRLRGAVHSRCRDRDAISYHYDLPPEFYSFFLDRRMVYSCAYFHTPEDGLEQAQVQKLDYICRKLRLRPGEHLLDIGCGWGALVIHATAHYGVHALGITLSAPQAEVARQRIHDSGLDDRCSIEVRDYRDLGVQQQFDKIVSVGMFEHVGEKYLGEYFPRTWQLLRPGGAFLNSGIAASVAYHRQGPSFIDRYVFPDGELVPLNASLSAAERNGFEVKDVESLRQHYALTLCHWVHRLEAHAEEARRVTDDTTYRTWRLYMAASAHRFRAAGMNLYQMLLAKPLDGKGVMPLTRADWYCG
jgi:cyclopropane-fatty-acyl-phospholipid synthase